MSMQKYPEQVDCAWLAIDSAGKAAVFITAGVGPIPEAVLESEVPIAEIESRLLELPSLGAVSLVEKIPSPESFIALAERGLFVFDWQNAHRTKAELKRGYDLIAIPSQAIDFVTMPPDLAGIAENVLLAKCSFGRERVIDVESALPCMFAAEG